MRFLQREVKKDGKGLYVHYGPIRLRPLKGKTRFEEGALVSMTEEKKYFPVSKRIFNGVEEYEIWQSRQR